MKILKKVALADPIRIAGKRLVCSACKAEFELEVSDGSSIREAVLLETKATPQNRGLHMMRQLVITCPNCYHDVPLDDRLRQFESQWKCISSSTGGYSQMGGLLG